MRVRALKTKAYSYTPIVGQGFKIDLKYCDIESEKNACSTDFSTPFTKKSDCSIVRDLSYTFATPKSTMQLFKIEKNVNKEKSLRKELREIKDQSCKSSPFEGQ